MKTTRSLLTAIILTQALSAQSLDPSGTWKFGAFELGYNVSSGPSVDWASSDIQFDNITISPNQTFTLPDSTSGKWFFSNDLFYAVGSDVQPINMSENLDTLSFADNEVNPQTGGTFERVNVQIGVRLPDTNFTSNDVAGTWNILRQTDITFQNNPGPSSGYNAVIHARDTLQLNSNGTFTLFENETTDPGGTDPAFSGTWSIVNNAILLAAGGETLEIPNLSSGLDTYLDFRTETFNNGSFTNFDRKIEVAVKQPDLLNASDVIGSWGVTIFTTEVDDDTPAFEQDFLGASYEMGILTINSGGSGTYTLLETSDPLNTSGGLFTWQINGKQLLITDNNNETFTFYPSAQKDFAVATYIDENTGGSAEFYEYITLTRLPNAPGFAAAQPRFNSLDELCIQTDPGFYYQLQRSLDLVSWSNIEAPILGDGTEKCVTDTTPPTDKAFYRWAIVAPPLP
ncbi:MAG: hypothetical protein AAGC74_00575 [Verrucomicrobiota bacterium]